MSELKIGSKEHYDMMDQFERDDKYGRHDRESDKNLWRMGSVYQDGETNIRFLAFRKGYSFAKSNFADEATDVLRARIDSLEKEVAPFRDPYFKGLSIKEEIREGEDVAKSTNQ